MKIEKILIVADDNPASIKAVEYGFELARQVNAKVLLLSVIDPASTGGNPDAGIFPDDAYISLKSKTEDFLKQTVKTYGQGVETGFQATLGEIMPTVLKTAADWQASLIVTGTHGRTGFSKLFFGSVAESIIQHSPVPVCVIPADK